jgi:hypothetical protein
VCPSLDGHILFALFICHDKLTYQGQMLRICMMLRIALISRAYQLLALARVFPQAGSRRVRRTLSVTRLQAYAKCIKRSFNWNRCHSDSNLLMILLQAERLNA